MRGSRAANPTRSWPRKHACGRRRRLRHATLFSFIPICVITITREVDDLIRVHAWPPSGKSRHLQPAHRAGTGGELVGFDPEALQHADEEVRQWVVTLAVEREMLAVLETAAGKQRGQVRGDVRVRVAEVRAVKNHRAVEQGVAAFLARLQFGEEMVE